MSKQLSRRTVLKGLGAAVGVPRGKAHFMDGITDEQIAILQRIAWDTVSNYRHAGIACTKYN